jgi:hypothetical protein
MIINNIIIKKFSKINMWKSVCSLHKCMRHLHLHWTPTAAVQFSNLNFPFVNIIEKLCEWTWGQVCACQNRRTSFPMHRKRVDTIQYRVKSSSKESSAFPSNMMHASPTIHIYHGTRRTDILGLCEPYVSCCKDIFTCVSYTSFFYKLRSNWLF